MLDHKSVLVLLCDIVKHWSMGQELFLSGVLHLCTAATLVKAHVKSYSEAPLQQNEFIACSFLFYRHFFFLLKISFNK